MSSNDEKTGLEQCKKALEQLRINLETDFNNAQYYNNTTIPEYRAELEDWEKRRDDAKDKHDRWKARRGEFSKYRGYGESQNFQLTWGWHDSPTTEYCKGCARRQHTDGWEQDSNDGNKMYKNIGGNQNIRCPHRFGTPLLGWDGYDIVGGKTYNGSRAEWVCGKQQWKKDAEIQKYNNAEPSLVDENTRPQEPSRPASTFNGQETIINCCGSTVNVIGSEVTDSNINQVNECIGNIEKGIENINEANNENVENTSQENEDNSNNTETYTIIGFTSFSFILISVVFIFSIILSSILSQM